MPWKAVWEKHRTFLIRVAGGLVVFLIGVTWIQGYRGEATAQVAKNAATAAAVEKDQGALDLTYDRERKEGRVLDKRRESLLSQVAVSRHARLKMPQGSQEDFEIDFAQQKSTIWREFESRANRVNLYFPGQKDVGFSITTDLEVEDWEDRYLQLDMIRRILNSVVDVGGVAKIDSIDPGNVATEPIAGSDNEAVVRYPVHVKMQLEYSSVLRLMERFQGSASYMSLEIEELLLEPGDPDGLLRASIDFIGVDIGEPRDTRRNKRSGSFRRGPRR